MVVVYLNGNEVSTLSKAGYDKKSLLLETLFISYVSGLVVPAQWLGSIISTIRQGKLLG